MDYCKGQTKYQSHNNSSNDKLICAPMLSIDLLSVLEKPNVRMFYEITHL
jgi:hypothetical protein